MNKFNKIWIVNKRLKENYKYYLQNLSVTRYFISNTSLEKNDISFKRKSFNYIHFSFLDTNKSTKFTLENFQKSLIDNFRINTSYSILIKVAFWGYKSFRMVGPQIGLVIDNSHDYDKYEDLYWDIIIRIDKTTENYSQILAEPVGIEIMYTVINVLPELKVKNIKLIKMPKELVTKKEFKEKFNNSLLPLTMNNKYYGRLLKENEILPYLEKITLTNYNFKDSFDITIKDQFYLYEYVSKKYNNKTDKLNIQKYLIIIKKDKDLDIKYVFSLNSGLFILKAEDQLLGINGFKRKIGNISIIINNNEIIRFITDFKLSPIKPKIKLLMGQINPNLGSFDIETYKDTNNISKVYCLGFFTNKDENPNLHWINDYENSNELVLACINNMLIPKYDKFIFYCHNFGSYDFWFIYKILVDYNFEYNKTHAVDYYTLEITTRNEDIIRLIIKVINSNTINNKKPEYITITFIDSYNLLNNSLYKLIKDFKNETTKTIFPYLFVNERTLNYVGDKPDIKFYDFDYLDKGEKNEKIITYNNIIKENWNLKMEGLSYLSNDLKSLLEIINIFSKQIYFHFNVDITDAMTISRLALNIFNKRYYNTSNPLPLINKHNIFDFINSAYYGGITEVYKPYGKNLYYLDVNSLYPYASINKPIPGLVCSYIEDLSNNGLELDSLFGFFYAQVSTNNGYLGLLPYKTNKGNIYPNGNFEGIWSSEELKFAKENGYTIKVIKGYHFNKNYDIFNNYVNDLYNKKLQSTGVNRFLYKSLLNNLIGRYAINLFKPIWESVDKEKRDYIASTRVLLSQQIINENTYWITYYPNISESICIDHGVDYLKALELEINKNINIKPYIYDNISISTSAMINSYARIEMNKIKLDLLKKGANLYYSDTDSLVIDKNIDITYLIGSEIGKFKLEHDINEAYFISNKTYCLKLNDDKDTLIIKAKGVNSRSLNIDSFKTLYWKNEKIEVLKRSSFKNYTLGYVNINSNDVWLNFDSYDKRTKIYDSNNIWIDTTPIVINNSIFYR
jgi:DNA polymerase type B, organellar and viral